MRKINYYSNILKKGTIIFNCATFVNYCSDHKNLNDPEYQKLLNDYKELGILNALIRGGVALMNKEEDKKEDGILAKIGNFFKTAGNVLMPKVTPISLLNEQMFHPFYAVSNFQLDEYNGIHYSFIKKNNNNKYLVFFHGILNNMSKISEEITSYDHENGIYGTKAYEKVFKDLDYNIILLEYNSILNKEKYEVTKERIEKDSSKEYKDIEINCAAKEYEELYGLDQINDISKLMADTIKRILNGKQIDELIISAHSHGNNYGLEILKKFINEDYHKDKLVYWGCKGYLDIEKTILKAANTFLGTVKNPIDFGNETNLFSKLMKIWNYKGEKKEEEMSVVDKVVLMLKALPIDQLLIFFKLLFFEYYDKIVKENNNEDRLISMFDKLDIKNYKLSEGEHYMKMKDFTDMLKEYEEYKKNKENDKIPCLLFYADEDYYVGDAFNTKITNTKSTEKIEDLAKAAAEKEKKYKKEDLQATEEIEKEIKKAQDDNNKKIKEIEKKIQQAANDNNLKINMNLSNTDKGARSFVLNINTGNDKEALEKYKEKEKEKEKENTKKEEEATTTTITKKKCCNYKKR